MGTKDREIAAGRFKARCLALLDEVATSRRPLAVTKRGKPVARLVPIDPPQEDALRGSVLEYGDVVSPLDEAWEVRE